MTSRRFRMLFFPWEGYPTDRVHIIGLFGKQLLARGHTIDLVMQAESPDSRTGRHDWFGGVVWVGRTVSGRTFVRKVRRLLLGIGHDVSWLLKANRNRYDIILVSDKYIIGAVAGLYARMRGLRFHFWMTYPYHQAQLTIAKEKLSRNPFAALIRGHLGEFVLRRIILPASHHVFVQSDKMASDFEAIGACRSKMTTILTGIDLGGVTPAPRQPHRAGSRTLVIGYLGTLVRQRRMDILVDMLHELKRYGVSARLLLIGDGDDRLHIENRARELGLSPNVQITGFLPRPQALELIQTADFCVSPFRPTPALDVASPTKLVEYLALGMPSIANSHPDQTLVLKSSRAGVVVPWGARHFARAAYWLSKRSEAELAEMGRRGQDWVSKNRTYKSIADTFERACVNDIPALD